jgi:hypothetical protein
MLLLGSPVLLLVLRAEKLIMPAVIASAASIAVRVNGQPGVT